MQQEDQIQEYAKQFYNEIKNSYQIEINKCHYKSNKQYLYTVDFS